MGKQPEPLKRSGRKGEPRWRGVGFIEITEDENSGVLVVKFWYAHQVFIHLMFWGFISFKWGYRSYLIGKQWETKLAYQFILFSWIAFPLITFNLIPISFSIQSLHIWRRLLVTASASSLLFVFSVPMYTSVKIGGTNTFSLALCSFQTLSSLSLDHGLINCCPLLLPGIFLYRFVLVLSRSVTSALCNPMDCSPPGFSVHEIFSGQEYWKGLPFPPPGDLLNRGFEPASPVAPALEADSLPLSHEGSPSL